MPGGAPRSRPRPRACGRLGRLQQRAGDVAADRLDEVADDLARAVLLGEAAHRRPRSRAAASTPRRSRPSAGRRRAPRRAAPSRAPAASRPPGRRSAAAARRSRAGRPGSGRPARTTPHSALAISTRSRAAAGSSGQPQPLVEHAGVDLGRRRGRRVSSAALRSSSPAWPARQPERLQRPPALLARARADQRGQRPLALGGQLRVGERPEVHGRPVRGRGLALGGRQQDQHGRADYEEGR